MRRKPPIAIVGSGNLASALAASLHSAGYEIEMVVGRSAGASQARALTLARKVEARASTRLHGTLRAVVVWLCVPDGEIHKSARAVARQIAWSGRVALHCSGALTSDELNALRQRGAMVASAHPLMTFVRRARPPFSEVPFAIEGDPHAVRVARQLIKDLGGRAYAIRKEEKAAYHAWATFVSPLFTALLATAEQVAEAAGIRGKQTRERALPILRQTLENYAAFGAGAGFSGPIVRGDPETVKRHLRVLRDIPRARAVYQALALAALDRLPCKKKAALRSTLKS